MLKNGLKWSKWTKNGDLENRHKNGQKLIDWKSHDLILTYVKMILVHQKLIEKVIKMRSTIMWVLHYDKRVWLQKCKYLHSMYTEIARKRSKTSESIFSKFPCFITVFNSRKVACIFAISFHTYESTESKIVPSKLLLFLLFSTHKR